MLKKEDLKKDIVVKNLKHGTLEIVTCLGKAKMNGEWKDAVFYHGLDRHTGVDMMFCREIDDFLPDFELAENTKIVYVCESYYTNGQSEVNMVSNSIDSVNKMKAQIAEIGYMDDIVLDHSEIYSVAIEKDVDVVVFGDQELMILG